MTVQAVLPARGRRRIWKSASVRLAALFGFLVLLTMLAALAMVYMQVSLILQDRITLHLQQEQQRIAAVYEQGGVNAAAQFIAQELEDGKYTDSELLLLARDDGTRLAGNLQPDALSQMYNGLHGQQRIQHHGEVLVGQVMVQRLDDDVWLVVGHDLHDLRNVEATVATASVSAGMFALLLALASTLFFRRQLGRNIGAMHDTIVNVSGGHLQARVPLDESADDAFAQLEQDFNHMLDRIAQLMDGVRHVSDTIAHNLRTPLTRVRLRLQSALTERHATTAEWRETMITASAEIDELSQMLDKLLSIAQAEAGMRRHPFETLTWSSMAEEVLELYEDLADEDNVQLQWHLDEPAPLQGDRSVLAGALVNVLDNAIKYAGSGRCVRLETSQTLRMVDGAPHSFSEISVEDNGDSLDAGAIHLLGERFTRLHPDKPGHGLGLASVRAMLRLHGGDMHLEHVAPGLKVTLSVPAG